METVDGTNSIGSEQKDTVDGCMDFSLVEKVED